MLIAGLDLSIRGSGITILDLDKDYNIQSKQHYVFVKEDDKGVWNKQAWIEASHSNNVILLPTNNQGLGKFNDSAETANQIYGLVKACQYVALEDYAFAKQMTNNVYDIAEFVGVVKHRLYSSPTRNFFRIYNIGWIKKFFSKNGNAFKYQMYDAYRVHTHDDSFEEVRKVCEYNKKIKSKSVTIREIDSPLSDIIDSFAIADLLRAELFLRLHEDIEIEHSVAQAKLANAGYDVQTVYKNKILEKGWNC